MKDKHLLILLAAAVVYCLYRARQTASAQAVGSSPAACLNSHGCFHPSGDSVC